MPVLFMGSRYGGGDGEVERLGISLADAGRMQRCEFDMASWCVLDLPAKVGGFVKPWSRSRRPAFVLSHKTSFRSFYPKPAEERARGGAGFAPIVFNILYTCNVRAK